MKQTCFLNKEFLHKKKDSTINPNSLLGFPSRVITEWRETCSSIPKIRLVFLVPNEKSISSKSKMVVI